MNLLNACGFPRLVAGDDVSRVVTVVASATLLVTLARASRRRESVILSAVGPILALVTVGMIGMVGVAGAVGMVVGDVYAVVGAISTDSWAGDGEPLYQSRTDVTSVAAPSSKSAIEFRPSSYAAVGGGSVVTIEV